MAHPVSHRILDHRCCIDIFDGNIEACPAPGAGLFESVVARCILVEQAA